MASSSIPFFTASQSLSHIHLKVENEACSSTCLPRAVVDGGSIFGLACPNHFHLPLVFPDKTLVDGTSTLGQTHGSSISLRRSGTSLSVDLLKQKEGEVILDLDNIQASVFPLLEEDEEGRNEERLFGLAMLQRGVEAMSSPGITNGEANSAAPGSMSQPVPLPPKVSKTSKTKVHECFSEADLDADEMASRKVATYKVEEKHWDEGMYLDNFVDEDGEIKHLIGANLNVSAEKDVFKGVASKVLESPASLRQLHLLLLELLLAQAYDYRTTLGESTVESAWTISVLCRSLVASCFPSSISGETVASVFISSMRRQLSFPLYRSWNLSLKVGQDVVSSLRKPCCHSLLLKIRRLFEEETEDEAMAIYSANVIAPLLRSYSNYFSETSLSLLADELEEAIQSVTKNQVGGNWDMEELEMAAQEALLEGEGGYV